MVLEITNQMSKNQKSSLIVWNTVDSATYDIILTHCTLFSRCINRRGVPTVCWASPSPFITRYLMMATLLLKCFPLKWRTLWQPVQMSSGTQCGRYSWLLPLHTGPTGSSHWCHSTHFMRQLSLPALLKLSSKLRENWLVWLCTSCWCVCSPMVTYVRYHPIRLN